MLEVASQASRVVISDPNQMAPYDAVELVAKAFDLLVVERRPDGWLWTGNPEHPRIFLDWHNNHWVALSPRASIEDEITRVSPVEIGPEQGCRERVSRERLRQIVEANHMREAEVRLAAGYHCPPSEKAVNRLRSVLAPFVEYLHTGERTVNVAGDHAAGLSRFIGGYPGVKIVNDYTGASSSRKVFAWNHDYLSTPRQLKCDLLVLHYNKLSPEAYDTACASAREIITLVDLREKLADHLDNFGSFIIPVAAKRTSTRVFHTTRPGGLTLDQARSILYDVWARLDPHTTEHYTNSRCRLDDFTSEIQRLLYLDDVNHHTIESRCNDWAGFVNISTVNPMASVYIDLANKAITYNEAAAEVVATPDFIDDSRPTTIFRYLGEDIRVVAPGAYRHGVDSAWSQNAADEGGPDGVPLPFYRRRQIAAAGDAIALENLLAACAYEIISDESSLPPAHRDIIAANDERPAGLEPTGDTNQRSARESAAFDPQH
jgi:hypothetical protein